VLPKSILFSLSIDRKDLLKKKNWKEKQFFHGVWDTALNLTNKNESYIQPNIKNKLLSSIKNFETKLVANILIKKNLSAVFLNHCVYFYRTLLSEFREKKQIQTFIQANFNIYKQNKLKDNSESILSNLYLKKLQKFVPTKDINNYWINRINGKSVYSLANDASNIKVKSKKKIPKNILMLHIFKDSPHNIIDNNRIFADYTDWLNYTLNIISKSNEKWGIKFHPSAHRWGENSKKIFDEFISKNFNSKIPNNFFLINNEFSNYEIFKKTKKLVTFWGTSHLESAAFGIKPIIIREVQLFAFDKKSVFKPSNLTEYKSRLITKNLDKFKLNKKQIENAKFLIFVREKVLNFINDIDQHWIMRGDKKKYINKNLIKTIKNINKYDKFLKDNGKLLSTNFTHTLSKKYIKLFLN
ncbi:hypothetical protein N9H38_04655, partial [Candidatus Pelagibacter sp.]|nr:hypothetical protein [Candidatus Pelagibacter sp.]